MNKKLFFNYLFLSVQLVMTILVITIKGPALNYISLSAIILCFLFSLLTTLTKNGNIFITLALAFTVTADVFLLMFNPQEKLLSMISFSITQIFYMIFLASQLSKHKTFWWVFRVCLIVIAEIVLLIVIKDKIDALSIISIFYYVNLITNLIISFTLFKNLPYMAIGFVLFLLCDTLVGLGVAFDNYIFIDHNSWLYKIVFTNFNLIWLFYVPAQTLLALSTCKGQPLSQNGKNNTEKKEESIT